MLRRLLALSIVVAIAPVAPAGHAQNVSGITWPDGAALPHFAQPQHLDVADLESAPGDEQLLFVTLQGIVNRSQPRIYLLLGGDEGKRTWLDDMIALYGVQTSEVPSPWDLIPKFVGELRGTIVYDPQAPDSINVATTMAGLRDAVVASPALADRLSADYGLQVLEDLRGRFGSRIDAYTWQYENLWPAATHRVLFGLPPRRTPAVHLGPLGAINVPLAPLYDTGLLDAEPFPFLRDYVVANRAMVFWLDANQPLERLLLERILAGVPPSTPYLGAHPGDVAGEVSMVAVLSSHGVYEVPADYFNNATVFGGVRPPLTALPQPPPMPPLQNKIYITFTMSDGDNIQYDQRRLRVLWNDPARGRVPINWTISPLLLDAAPAILDYYRRTATPNDLFMAGPSGIGYAYPSAWPDDTFRTFTRQTGDYMRRTDMDTLDVLNMPYAVRSSLSETKAGAYIDDAAPRGILLNWFLFPECRTENVVLGGTTPATTGCLANSIEEARFDVRNMSRTWDGRSPLFLSIEFIAWSVRTFDVATFAAGLGSPYEVVRADTYFDLLREALGLPGAG